MAAATATIVIRKMQALEKSVTGKGPMIGVAKWSKQILESEARKDMGADMALSNWRRSKPVKVRVRDDFISPQELKITPRPVGPMQVITHGRSAGVSNRRKTKGRPISSSRGKGTWTRGRVRVERDAPRQLSREYIKSAVAAFRK
jgi:hypothetical protein